MGYCEKHGHLDELGVNCHYCRKERKNPLLSVCKEDIAAIVLCKNELYFQGKNGGTLAIWFPCCKEAGEFIAFNLDVPFSTQ